MVRLKEVAAAAGVSMMTVSKALRNAPDVANATRDRIQSLAQRMGYVPDAVARGLRNRKSRLLGLVIPATTDPIFSRVMLAVEERAHQAGYDLLLAHSLGTVEREAVAIRRLIARRVEGLLISPVYRLAQRAPVYDEIRRRRIPTIILGHRAAFCHDFPNVETDDRTSSRAITEHLISLGHRRIAFFAGPLAAPWAQERVEGYRRALRESGLEVNDQLIFNAGSTLDEGAAAAMLYSQEKPGATAIQCANDLVAVGAANALLNQGLRIPHDVSVAGFGNLLVAEFFRVPLTTVRQPKLRLGSLAIASMLELLRGEPITSHRLSAQLALRASTGPAPAG
jgi:LacI family repressor for deo operon, udp, cdd, tsx, nupC, and nupG